MKISPFGDQDGAQTYPRFLPGALLSTATYLTLFIFGLQFAYYVMFTNDITVDDEGTIILLVDSFIKSRGNFDVIGEYQYHGPLFFLVKYLIHYLSNTDISHNTNRLTTVVFWGLIPIISAFFVHRVTRSLILAAIVQLLLIFHLLMMISSAGHPQELSLLLIAIALLFSSYVGSRPSSAWPVAGIAAVVGALLLVKINIGVYLGAALALSMLVFLPPRKLTLALFALAAGAAVLLPFAVIGKLAFQNLLDRNYCAQVTLVVIACLVVARKHWKGAELRWSDVGWAVFAVLGTVAFICGVVIAMGGSLGGIVNTVLLRPLQLSTGDIFHPALKFSDVNVAAISVLLAVGYRIAAPKLESSGRWLGLLCAVKIAFGSATLFSMYFPARLDIAFRALSFAWLLFIPPLSPSPNLLRISFPRVFLCFAAAFQSLQAFPVAGSQQYWSVFLLVPVAATCLADGFSLLWLAIGRRWSSADPRVSQHTAGWIMQTLVILCLVYFSWQKMGIGRLPTYYSTLPALVFDGANRIHLPKKASKEVVAVVGSLKKQCDGFVAIPGMPSLYYWSGIQPPGIITDYWVLNMDGDQQKAIIDTMEKYKNPCVVYNPERLKIWTTDNEEISQRIPKMPLVKYINNHYATVRKIGNYQILHKKPASPVARTEAVPIH